MLPLRRHHRRPTYDLPSSHSQPTIFHPCFLIAIRKPRRMACPGRCLTRFPDLPHEASHATTTKSGLLPREGNTPPLSPTMVSPRACRRWAGTLPPTSPRSTTKWPSVLTRNRTNEPTIDDSRSNSKVTSHSIALALFPQGHDDDCCRYLHAGHCRRPPCAPRVNCLQGKRKIGKMGGRGGESSIPGARESGVDE